MGLGFMDRHGITVPWTFISAFRALPMWDFMGYPWECHVTWERQCCGTGGVGFHGTDLDGIARKLIKAHGMSWASSYHGSAIMPLPYATAMGARVSAMEGPSNPRESVTKQHGHRNTRQNVMRRPGDGHGRR